MGKEINMYSSTGPLNQIRKLGMPVCYFKILRTSGAFMCKCVTEHIYTHVEKQINMLNVMSQKSTHIMLTCLWIKWGVSQWDNWRKVMLLINSIQQTLRRYDYLAHTVPVSPAMLIIVVSHWWIFLLFLLFFLFLQHTFFSQRIVACYQTIKTFYYQVHRWWLSEAMSC